MHETTHEFIHAMAVVLCVAAVTTVLFQRLKQPVVLGYLIAGLIVGPHLPIPLVASATVVQTLSEMGVILLMFALGLEFSLRKLIKVGPAAGITAVIQCALMIWLGFIVGRAFGWTTKESIFTGAIIAISSTTIIAKAFDERGIKGKLRELVVGVLIVEDLIAVLLMATLTAISSGAGLTASALAATVGRLGAFLTGLIVIGLLVVPRAIRYVARLNRPETTLVTAVGICFGVALLAMQFGYSVALGAFLAGSLIAESGEEAHIEHLVQPLRDVFAAVFFVSVGMLIDPKLVAQHWLPVIVLTVVVIVGKVFGVTLGAFLTGAGTRTSVQSGMSLAQIGEFSFIIAGLGLSLNATGTFLYPVAVAVSAITTLTTPWLIGAAGPAASLVDRKMPRAMQTFASLYGTWIEGMRSKPALGKERRISRTVGWIAVDVAFMAGILIAGAVLWPRLAVLVEERTAVSQRVAALIVAAAVTLLASPFGFGIIRLSRRLGVALAERVLPPSKGRVDLADAPRRALVVTLQLATVLFVGLPLLAVTQPFLPGYVLAAVMLGGVLLLGRTFWKTATNLQGHVRAGAQVIVEALAAQSHVKSHEEDLSEVRTVLPGLGDPVPVQVEAGSPSVGQSLAALNLRGATGATVLAIRRGEEQLLLPKAADVIAAGDVVALAGTREAIAAARTLLLGSGNPTPA